ncbi:MAG TPA: 23S rRNA (adenine(2030)-N(6))-methyltransferase RlmJ [Verrucomicrobiae bacterium]|nr:23S rRNA (adenine(2030)-N(6))-methyltransferase RlmJ [Verrucomicrobiae bacterium]
MHYRHGFHAGNFADVFKHAVLCGLLAALSRKDKPWGYLETHAGAGAYDLSAEGAERTGEWRDGIGRLHGLGGGPEPLQTLLDIVRGMNGTGTLRHYPGSPLFAQALARDNDRLIVCEKIPEVAAELRENLKGERRAAVHQRDGYEAHALLPPAEKRGLTLIDPPFERPDEFDAVAGLVEKSLKRFAGGIYAMWYPLKNAHAAARFERRVARVCVEPPLRLALHTGAPGEGQLRGCAVLVVNAPFGFERDFDATGRLLARELARGPHPKYEAAPVTGEPAPRQNELK